MAIQLPSRRLLRGLPSHLSVQLEGCERRSRRKCRLRRLLGRRDSVIRARRVAEGLPTLHIARARAATRLGQSSLGSHPCSRRQHSWCAASRRRPPTTAARCRCRAHGRTLVELAGHGTGRLVLQGHVTAHCRILPGERARRRHSELPTLPWAVLGNSKIAALIRSKCPEAVCLLYQGASGPPTPDDLRFWSLGPDGKRTGPTPTLPDAPKTLPVLEGYLDSSVHHKLVDFDVHLDDASRDWLNTALLA